MLAQEIARLLGDDHDLAVLKTFTAEKIGAGITPKQAEILFGLVQGRQQKLRAKAKILGGALMAASPKGLARETEAYWDMALERWSERKALKVNGRATDEHDIGDALEGGADAAEEEIAEANRPDSPLIQ